MIEIMNVIKNRLVYRKLNVVSIDLKFAKMFQLMALFSYYFKEPVVWSANTVLTLNDKK